MKISKKYLAIILYFKLSVYSIIHTVFSEDSIPNQYIVKLRDYVNSESFVNQIVLNNINGMTFYLNSSVKYTYITLFNGFSAALDRSQYDLLNAMNEVEYISEDYVLKLYDNPVIHKQSNAVWGLARLSTRKQLTGSSYTYNYNSSAGKNTYAYIIDSGINIRHKEFEGRAILGKNFVENEKNDDLNGHGTHCAGTVAGKTYGVAKKAHVIAVKVFDSSGRGLSNSLNNDFFNNISLLMRSMEWVMNDAKKYGINRCVMSMSLGGPRNRAVIETTEKAIKLGMTVVVAAGNDRIDACRESPASAPNAITVGATDKKDNFARFSNFGKCIDILAPGVGIESAAIGSNSGSTFNSGTSMAAPHITGLVCYFKSIGYDRSPKQVEDIIKKLAAKNMISGLSGNTVNLIAQNDMTNNILFNYN